MEAWLRAAAKIGTAVQERDRQTSEEVALELLITKHNRTGNQEMVDVLLDTLAGVQKEEKATDAIIQEWFDVDISELRQMAVDIRVALNNHEAIMDNLSEVNRALEILIAGRVLDDDPEGVREDLLEKREILRAQLAKSAELLDEMIGLQKVETSEETISTDTSEVVDEE